MRWTGLLSTRRLGEAEPKPPGDLRSPFEIDVDRLVFSSAFRRLQAKMQVHGPALRDEPGDYVRTRLTHSLEVSRVGRSLGQLAGAYLHRRGLAEGLSPAEIGHVVSAGSIAHDIGQTPFSHEGEQAISHWWSSSALAAEILAGLPPEIGYELTRFEGNAFGFRLLARLEGWRPHGGLQFTAAVLGAFCKYPWSGGLAPEHRPHPMKYGIFLSEIELFREVAAETGLIEIAPDIWCRHPLAYLTEAADDICYRIVDIEDAVEVGVLGFGEAEQLLAPLARPEPRTYRELGGDLRKLTYLRARAIQSLIEDASAAWARAHDRMLAGEQVQDLLSESCHGDALERIADVSRTRIYRGRGRVETVLIAHNTLALLLDSFAPMLLRRERSRADTELSLRDRALLALLEASGTPEAPFSRTRETWVRQLMDHIAALTDRGALREAGQIGGG